MNAERIQIDKAGRLVLPKRLRDQLNLVPGDNLRVWLDGTTIRLEPESGRGELIRKGSVLVFTGHFSEPVTTRKINEMLESDREARLSSRGKLRKK